ncbi:phage tail protein [Limosilactobacillus reuteri]|uniref:phage tail protein n=1 Tax=Limosilactobacillus reuteri TaxID=1598 RepID=UPI003F25C49C
MRDYTNKITVQDHLNVNHKANLRSFLPDTYYWTAEVNGDFTMQFTAYDDGSEAYALLITQNIIYDHGQAFVIKQVSDVKSGGATALQVTCSQVMSELSRWRVYPAVTADGNNNQQNTSDQTTVKGPQLDANNMATVTPKDILQYYVGDANGVNAPGFTWKVIGSFSQQPVLFDATDLKSGISKITATWTDAVIYPNGYEIDVYDHDSFYKYRGHRIDYLHDTSQVQLDTDSTVIKNQFRVVGATYSNSGTGTADTGLPNGAIGPNAKGAQAVIADAKKYLGVPYVWGGAGGARGGNPFSGMDCSSFVSQVYKDFGISIPAYTVAMEPYGHEVGRSQVQTGDMGFYGSHGGSFHICMAIDNNTMIYEPAPGQSCKTQSIDSYPPTWWERNDQMAEIVSSGGGLTGGDDGTDADTETYNDQQDQYYFQPFLAKDEDSIKRWGLFDGGDLTNDQLTDPTAAEEYAKKQFVPNPALSVQITKTSNDQPVLGDIVRFEIKTNGYVEQLPTVGYTWYPYSKVSQTTVNLNSNPKSMLDYDASFNDGISKQATIFNGWGNQTWTRNEVRTFGENIERSDPEPSKPDQK